MKFLIVGSLFVAGASAQLVHYPNGAVAPSGGGGYGKRQWQVLDPATNLVTYPNGAVAPFDPNVAAATVHPAAAVVYGRKKREAQVPVNLVTGHTATAYLNPFFGHHVAIAPVTSPFTAHPNGALVPAEPAEVVEAREAHLAAVAEAGRKKREAQVPVNLVTGLAATTYINPFFGHHLAVAPVPSPFTAYPNGALVPEEPADVAEARAAHLEALAAASK